MDLIATGVWLPIGKLDAKNAAQEALHGVALGCLERCVFRALQP